MDTSLAHAAAAHISHMRKTSIIHQAQGTNSHSPSHAKQTNAIIAMPQPRAHARIHHTACSRTLAMRVDTRPSGRKHYIGWLMQSAERSVSWSLEACRLQRSRRHAMTAHFGSSGVPYATAAAAAAARLSPGAPRQSLRRLTTASCG